MRTGAERLVAALIAAGAAGAAAQDAGRVPHAVAGHTLFLPPGFRVALFAEDLPGVRYLQLGPGGTVYASRPRAGVIVRLPDANGDGVADSAVIVLDGVRGVFGLAFRGDTLYFTQPDAVRRLDPGSATPITLVSGIPTGGHSTRTVVFGPDGLMYVSIGSSCNVCDESDPRRAAVVRYHRDGTGEQLVATGLRNSIGLAFHPVTGELWATNNDRDNLGDDVPPERINILRSSRNYGWPRCYLPGTPNPEYPGADCASVEPPAITFQAHSAPLGLRFYTGTRFPTEYRGGGAAFVAYHGSWNRSVPTGAKVVRVAVRNGRPVSVDDFVTGWQLSDGNRWGRPVDLLVTVDGALLISDDLGGRIWRVSYEP